jgi:hypothetical protein
MPSCAIRARDGDVHEDDLQGRRNSNQYRFRQQNGSAALGHSAPLLKKILKHAASLRPFFETFLKLARREIPERHSVVRHGIVSNSLRRMISIKYGVSFVIFPFNQ